MDIPLPTWELLQLATSGAAWHTPIPRPQLCTHLGKMWKTLEKITRKDGLFSCRRKVAVDHRIIES